MFHVFIKFLQSPLEVSSGGFVIVYTKQWNHKVTPSSGQLFYFVINSAFPPAFSIAS